MPPQNPEIARSRINAPTKYLLITTGLGLLILLSTAPFFDSNWALGIGVMVTVLLPLLILTPITAIVAIVSRNPLWVRIIGVLLLLISITGLVEFGGELF